MWDALWVNGRLATMAAETRAAPYGAPYGAIEDGALAVAVASSPGSGRAPICRARPIAWRARSMTWAGAG